MGRRGYCTARRRVTIVPTTVVTTTQPTSVAVYPVVPCPVARLEHRVGRVERVGDLRLDQPQTGITPSTIR